MSQCVPSWDLDDNNPPTPAARLSYRSSHSNSSSCATPDVPMLDYEVAELTWENGQLAMHGLGPRRVPTRHVASTSPSKYTTWDKRRASGTLESIVNQATHTFPQRHHIINNNKPPNCEVVVDRGGGEGGRGTELVPWFDGHHRSANNTSITLTRDALVPCSNRTDDQTTQVMDSVPGGAGTCVVGCSTRVGSCSGSVATQDDDGVLVVKRSRVAPVPTAAAGPEWSSRDQSVSGSATFGRDSQRLTGDTCERELGAVGFTSSSFGSQDNTSGGGRPLTKTITTAATADENDSVCHSRPQREAADEEDKKKRNGKSSVSTKRSRAAAIHNQSERKRRDKINQRMKTLQKLVPNSSKTDKASMLDEVIDYLKQLQAQVQMMSRMNMQSAMILPMTLQQQLQMSMMATPMNMGMGMAAGMGMGVMDMNTIARSNITGISSVLHPAAAFMPGMTSWDGSGDRLQAVASATAAAMPDPLSAFLAYQPQPMTMDAYSKMVAMYQQLQQQRSPLPSCKS